MDPQNTLEDQRQAASLTALGCCECLHAAGDWMLWLRKGTVGASQRGAFVGELSLLHSASRYANCTAIEAVQAGGLGRPVGRHRLRCPSAATQVPGPGCRSRPRN